MKTTIAPLQQTKLYRPPLPRDLVRRARLIDELNLSLSLPLTLVSAPAGSGKTTLLSDWLSTCPCPSAWLSLDEDDSALPVFVSYLIAALRTLFPEACGQTLALLQASEGPPGNVLTRHLINEIENLSYPEGMGREHGFVLVLDDYHRIVGQAVNELLIELLRHPLRTLHLVLATRSDPALPLANLRARGGLLEIRRHDLRFTEDETAAYLNQTLAAPVGHEVAALLVGKMEGWVTGLHLVALNLRQTADPAAFVLDLSSGDRYVMDYLLDEVLACQPQPVQEFLLETSILDQMNEDLCSAVTRSGERTAHGQNYLQQIEQANLFVVAVDHQGRWYRYHHLFQQFLRYRLVRWASPAQIADLHRRASHWYRKHGFVEDAIAHALSAGDETAAVQAIEAHRHAAMNQERWPQIEQWLRLLPRHLVDAHPELLLLEAWIWQRRWRLADIGPLLDRSEALLASGTSLASGTQTLRAEIDALRGLISYYTLDGAKTLAYASRALQALPMHCSSARGLAYMYCAAGHQALGDIESARQVLHEGLKEDSAHGNAFPARVLIALCILHLTVVDLYGLRQTATYFLKLAHERDMKESIFWAQYFLGCAAYFTNDLAAAERDFAAVVEHRYLAHSYPFSQSAFGLASVHLAQGAGDRAQAVMELVMAYGMEMHNTRVLMDGQAFQAWLALRQGRSAEARHWADSAAGTIPLVPMTTFHAGIMTLAKILALQDNPGSPHRASDLLARVSRYTESQCVTRFTIEVRALQALVADSLGDSAASRLALHEALTLAEPGGLVRVFVDLGPRMARLLARLGQQNGTTDFADRILRAFPAEDTKGLSLPVLPHVNQSALIEPLTQRELEVLALLAQRLSAKEMAQRLVISDRTAKRHTANIYQKLGVNSRREAIEVATALGILNPLQHQ